MTRKPAAVAEPLRVAWLVPEGVGGKGGIQRLALYMKREFDRAIADVELCPVATRSTDRQLLKHIGTAPAMLRFALACRRRAFDIVHINVAPKGSTWRKMLFARIARGAGLKTVIHLHGSGYDDFYSGRSRTAKAAIRRFFQSADAVIVLGAHWRAFAIDGLAVRPDRISVIPNGVPEPSALAKPEEGPPLIVTMGAIGERKGTDVLIAALACLPAGLAWRAVVGGNGDLARYQAAASAAGIGDKVEFLGWLDEAGVDSWMRRSSIFVLPSRAENQPMAILEAMARGLPVISTTIGAIPEQVLHGETGLLVPPGDAQGLGAALAELLTSDDLRAGFGAAGRARFDQRFSIAACAQAFANLYRQLERGTSREGERWTQN